MSVITDSLESVTSTLTENKSLEKFSKNIEELYLTLSRIIKLQELQFLNTSIDYPLNNTETSANSGVLTTEEITSYLRMTDSLLNMNWTKKNKVTVLENIENMNYILILCLELRMSIGDMGSINLQNYRIEYTVQNTASMGDKYEFSELIFPIVSEMQLNNTDYYGISRMYWKINTHSSKIKNENLASNMSGIDIYSLNTKKKLNFSSILSAIQIKFSNLTKTDSDEYYCVYFNETNQTFSDYNLFTIIMPWGVICETTHLSVFGVIVEPLVIIGTENNVEMLYDFGALQGYQFWISSSIYIYLYIYIYI